MNEIGSRLKKARIDSGYTQQQIADILNLARSTITHYELGTNEPDINTLRKLSEIYEVTSDWIIGTKVSTKKGSE